MSRAYVLHGVRYSTSKRIEPIVLSSAHFARTTRVSW